MPKQPLSGTEHEPQHLRTLVYEPEYVEAIESLFGSVKRADDVLGGLELFIGRRAEMGLPFDGYPEEFGTWLSTPLPDGSRVRVLYFYTSQEAHLLDAWIVSSFSLDPRA